MTDKVSDFFKDIKERFSSPFFSSFVIAWLIINWKVPVALFWYDQGDLRRDGYISFIDLIRKNSTTNFFLWLPLISALLYTFGYPFLRNGILAFNAWIRKWGTELVISVSKESKIPMRAFLQLREKYYQQTKLLETVIGQENTFQSENATLRNKISEVEVEKNKFAIDIKTWMERNQISFLDGEWELITEVMNTKISERVMMTAGSIRIYNTIKGQGSFIQYQYDHFSYNHLTKMVSLDFRSEDGKERMHNILQDKSGSLEELVGTSYRMSTVELDQRYGYNVFKVTFKKLTADSSEKIQVLAV
jgi:hypothetical protein